MLCPDAQMLLIADTPANQDMSVGARLLRKQRSSTLTPTRLLNNGTSTEDSDDSDAYTRSQSVKGQTPLSMILPRRALSDKRFAKMLPEESSQLIEVQCKNFDLFPLMSTSSALAAV